MRSARSVVATLLLSLPLARGWAQEPRRLAQPDSVPFDLASALVGAGGLGGEPQILVGSLPGWVTGRIKVSPNANVLGSAFFGSTVVGILSLSDSPETAIADMKRDLLAQGWRAPPPQPSYGGGFRPATMYAMVDGTPTRITLCGDQQLLTVSAIRRRGTTTEVTLRLSPSQNYSTCSPQPFPQGVSRSPFPTLYNPSASTDARITSACSSQYGSSGTSTTLMTAIAATGLLDHYGKQLQDSGWHAPAPGNSIAGRTWTKVDSAGTPLELNLTVATSARDSTCREINMQVRTMRKP